MTLKFQHYLRFVPLSLGICFISCTDYMTDCNLPDPITYNLSADERTKIPYTANENLTFISNNGDTAKLSVDSNGLTQSYYPEIENPTYNPDCPGQYAYYENNSIKIYGSAFIHLIKLNAYYYKGPDDFNYARPSHSLDITINSNEDIYTIRLASLKDVNYNDTVSVNGITYNGIKILAADGSEIVYNHLHGILRIKSPDNKIWTAMF